MTPMTPSPPDDEVLFELADRVSDAFRHHRSEPDRIAAIIDEALQRPGIEEVLQVSEVLADLAEAHSLAGRTVEALAAHDRAVAAGWECIPDARMDRARYLIRGGRLDEARALHAAVAEQFPDDVWFYNAAGLNEVEAADTERAIDWFGQGIELILHQGDAERVLAQLLELREENLTAAGREPDDLQCRGKSFLETELEPPEPVAVDPWEPTRPGWPFLPLVAWFPQAEFERALDRWPQLAERWGTRDFHVYLERLEDRLDVLRRELGQHLDLVPVVVDDLVTFASDSGLDPGHPAVQHRLAARAHERGAGRQWPPGRNEPCWCGSGAKYKRCCGAPFRHRPGGPNRDPELPWYELDVTLEGASPSVWRRIQLPAAATFMDLHHAIQAACGWSNDHLFAFYDVSERPLAGIPIHRELSPPDPDAAAVALEAYFGYCTRCTYLYDFGDSWRHEIVLRQRVAAPPSGQRRLVAGARAFPPEDCGGLSGYQRCVEAARGDDPDDVREWLGTWDPEAFDLEATQANFD